MTVWGGAGSVLKLAMGKTAALHFGGDVVLSGVLGVC